MILPFAPLISTRRPAKLSGRDPNRQALEQRHGRSEFSDKDVLARLVGNADVARPHDHAGGDSLKDACVGPERCGGRILLTDIDALPDEGISHGQFGRISLFCLLNCESVSFGRAKDRRPDRRRVDFG